MHDVRTQWHEPRHSNTGLPVAGCHRTLPLPTLRSAAVRHDDEVPAPSRRAGSLSGRQKRSRTPDTMLSHQRGASAPQQRAHGTSGPPQVPGLWRKFTEGIEKVEPLRDADGVVESLYSFLWSQGPPGRQNDGGRHCPDLALPDTARARRDRRARPRAAACRRHVLCRRCRHRRAAPSTSRLAAAGPRGVGAGCVQVPLALRVVLHVRAGRHGAQPCVAHSSCARARGRCC